MCYFEVDSMDNLRQFLKALGSHTKQANNHIVICYVTFPESIRRCLTGPQPYSKTVHNHTVKFNFYFSFQDH